MPFTSALRHAFSSPKSQQPVAGVYTQSPAEQYRRPSQPTPSRPLAVSLPPSHHEAGAYSQSPREVYRRRDSQRHSQPVELPQYQRVAANNGPLPDYYAPRSECVPVYSRRETPTDAKHDYGRPPQYQK